jgi:hypothetical protein
MKTIFRLEAWHIFIFIILPIFFPENLIGFTLIFVSLFGAWAWSLAEALYPKLPGGHTLNLVKFKTFLIIPAIYFLLVTFFMNGGYSINNSNFASYGAIAYLLVPLHLFCMYCMFYCIYFLAKSIECVESRNKNPNTSDYIGDFFCLWFIPIGIWFIQPKIQRIFRFN